MNEEPVEIKDPERGKRIHRAVMVGIGFFWVAAGLWAAYLASTSGAMPAFLVRRWRGPEAPSPLRQGGTSRVVWNTFSPELLARAREEHKPLLLDLTVTWCRACHVMDETTYADAGIAAWIQSRTVPVRVDGDERPDLALRYLSGGWPTTAILMPSGEILSSGTLMPPERFLPWAEAVLSSFDARFDEFSASAAKALAETRRVPSASIPSEPRALLSAQLELGKDWDADTGGFGASPRFPDFGRIRALRALATAPGAAWTQPLAAAAAAGDLHLEDPVWGGFFRYAAGPGWSGPEHEKLLNDQAEAVLALEGLQDAAVARTLAYVQAFLSDPAGGWYASQSAEVMRPDGRVVEGAFYYSLPDAKRRALGLPEVDRRLFAAPNARMARAVLQSKAADASASKQAFKSLERFWREAVSKEGAVLHFIGGKPQGLRGYLEDQVALSQGFLAAYRRTGQRVWLDRARTTAGYMETTLKDPASPAFLDRPARGEFSAALDRSAIGALNLEAAGLLLDLAQVSAPAERARLKDRSRDLAGWLSARALELDPAGWAAFIARQG